MAECKVTVLKRTLNPELAKEYVEQEVELCPVFKEGQEFIVPGMFGKPEGFCDWAWNDIYKSLAVIARGGNFSDDAFAGWMNSDKKMITCCTDGIRPVIFSIERID